MFYPDERHFGVGTGEAQPPLSDSQVHLDTLFSEHKLSGNVTAGKHLRAARLRARLTQEEVAQRLGVSKAAVSGWETGAFEPLSKNVRSLAQIYHVSEATLRSGSNWRPRGLVAQEGTSKLSLTHAPRARAFINRLLAEIAEAGGSADDEAWVKRIVNNPANFRGYTVGGSSGFDEHSILCELTGLSAGIRAILHKRGLSGLRLK